MCVRKIVSISSAHRSFSLMYKALNSRHVASTQGDYTFFFYKHACLRCLWCRGCSASLCLTVRTHTCVRVCGVRSDWLGSTSKGPASLCINKALCSLPPRLQHVSPHAANERSVYTRACAFVRVRERKSGGHRNPYTKSQGLILLLIIIPI